MPTTATLSIHWHLDNQPIYSAHFEQNGKGRLATASGDTNVRLWKLHGDEEKKVTYLSTLSKHTQAVNVVRFCPRGEMLASAGDDGNVILWVPSDAHQHKPSLGEDDGEDKETWRQKHMCRSSTGSEIYDLAWSPDGEYFITGSMDNIARIYSSQTGHMIRQIAEHNHYVQGVAWDPLNEYVATQSSDRSVHIYSLKTKDGTFTLNPHGKVSRMDLPPRRTTSGSPIPIENTSTPAKPVVSADVATSMASPVPSMPGTPNSFSLPMLPAKKAHSRRSSFSSSPSLRRSPSPSPALPLPAIKHMDSPKYSSLGARNANIYCNDAMTSFFRRLTFTPDGSLLLTPAGQYKVSHPTAEDGAKNPDEVINTVYIYTRAGLNKPPIAHLPGHKKPSVAVSCSPILYTFRKAPVETKHITVDTTTEESISALPPPAITTEMDPPAIISGATQPGEVVPTNAAFALPYRIVYAVATQDSVLIYDTQQQTPLCLVSNLHYAAFTDLTWSPDGLTLFMTSTDGFCSVIVFQPGELGTIHAGNVASSTPTHANLAHRTPQDMTIPTSNSPLTAQSTGSGNPRRTPASPVRSLSNSSVNTITSMSQYPGTSDSTEITNNPTPVVTAVPSITASSSNTYGIPMATPPATPAGASGSTPTTTTNSTINVLGKRDAETTKEDIPSHSDTTMTNTSQAAEAETGNEVEKGGDKKRRRIAPTLISAKEH